MPHEFITKKPFFVDEKYKKMFKGEPCKHLIEYGEEWYKGTGVEWNEHPLKSYLPKWASVCAQCKEDSKIIAARLVIDPHSGTSYWENEVYCEKCKKFTQRTNAEKK
jgi:hypothetical protein